VNVSVQPSSGAPGPGPLRAGVLPQSLFGSEDADELFQTDVRFVEFAPPPGQDRFLEYLESLPKVCG